MDKIKNIVDSSTEVFRATYESSRDSTFRLTEGLLNSVSKIVQNQIKSDLTALNEEAFSEYAVGMEQVRHFADMSPAGGLAFMDEQSQELKNKIRETYGELGEEFETKTRNVLLNNKIKFLSQTGSSVSTVSFGNIKKSSINLARSAFSMPRQDLENSLESIRTAARDAYGESAAEMIGFNSKALAEIRLNPTHVPTQPPVVTESNEYTEMNTRVGTKLIQMSVDNPMLARGFNRIRGMTFEEAAQLAKSIAEQYPDSPESAAIETANSLRARAVELNPLQFGENQLMYKLSSDPNDVFTGENDLRFNSASFALRVLGNTNFFTEEERALLKAAPTQRRVEAFAKIKSKLDVFNSKTKNPIYPQYLDRELKSIDQEAANWVELINAAPEFSRIDLDAVKINAENLRKINATPSFSVPEALYGVSDIGKLYELANAAEYMRTGSTDGFKRLISTKRGYAYLSKYDYGARFEDEVIKIKNRNVFLKNVGLDTFRVYERNGAPLLEKGSTVEFSGAELERRIELEKSM